MDGQLAVSRSLGDFEYKQNKEKKPHEQKVIAGTDSTVNPLAQDVHFVMLACDGIWDVKTNQDVVDKYREYLDELDDSPDPGSLTLEQMETFVYQIMNECVSEEGNGVGCDNMSAIFIEFVKKEDSD